ncbi:MAG: hypothetical protein ACK5M4_12430 [Pseudorhodobacter sp.]
MHILIYANVGLNLIDGSTIWVQSLAEILAAEPGCVVTVLSRDIPEDRGTCPALRAMAGVRLRAAAEFPDILDAYPEPGDARAISQIIARIAEEEGLDRILIRAPDVALHLARNEALRHRLWAYVLQSPELLAQSDHAEMAELAEHAGGLIVQSDAQRGLLEAVLPAAANKTSILPPMVKPVAAGAQDLSDLPEGPGVRFVYSGKYSATWNVEAFFDVPASCRAAGVQARVTMIGDKVHNEPGDRGFRARILKKFTTTPGVTWLGAMGRDAAIAVAAHHDLGLCWRSDALNDSLEISTKFLEFASQGVPAVVNRTAAYETLLGKDYPYFATSMEDVVAAAKTVTADPARHERIRARMRDLAGGFTYEAAGRRLHHALRFNQVARALPQGERIRLLVASHDLKFLTLALRWLEESRRYRIAHDRWQSTNKHDPGISQALLADADAIFCEFCAGQAGWYSRNKRPDQKLFIRLHRFEAFTDMPRRVDIGAVDGVIVVSDYLRDYCVREFGWPAEKLVVLPQYCIAEQFDRPKHPGAERTLGLVGINEFRKRPDRALEILRLLHREHPDFRLRIRSVMPWDLPWLWNKPEEKRRYLAFFAALEADTDLRQAVIFDRPGANMAEWMRNIGFLLSTSESEGCHTVVAEGLCSGAMPAVINWDGARSIYGEYVHDTVEEMAAAIARAAKAPMGAEARTRMQDEARAHFDIGRTVEQLDRWFSGAAPSRDAILRGGIPS